ncbi:hypothetical protein Tco_1122421 [Tanacetum coccineum]|uniref:Uncharacterized protein n=1 Tax=Tanacetum coccineum TaxID=301880 RepID=A0ABQ5J1J2_9ASTR
MRSEQEKTRCRTIDLRPSESITKLAWFKIGCSGLGHIPLGMFQVTVAVSGLDSFDKNDLPQQVTQLVHRSYKRGGSLGVWFFLSRINAPNHALRSATTDETACVEELVLILATTTFVS